MGSPAVIAAAAAILVAFVGAVINYIIAARKMAGTVTNSQSDELWEQWQKLNEANRDRQVMSEVRTANLEKRVAELEYDNNDLRRELNKQISENRDLSSKLMECSTKIEKLTEENLNLQGKIIALEKRLAERRSL